MKFEDFPLWSEIKSEYMELRASGKGRSASVDALLAEYHCEVTTGQEDDGVLFWIALADAQYALKELSDDVAGQGMQALNILKACFPISSRSIKLREDRYSKAPMPERKVRSGRPKYRCNWKNGDTFAIRISGEQAQEQGIAGFFALLRKVDEMEFGDGRLLPVVTLSLWGESVLPRSSEEFQRVPFLRLNSGRLGTPGDSYEYRVEILHKNEKQVEKMGYIYLGNFQNVKMPEDEFVFKKAGHMMMLIPDMFCDEMCIFWKMDQYYEARQKEAGC